MRIIMADNRVNVAAVRALNELYDTFTKVPDVLHTTPNAERILKAALIDLGRAVFPSAVSVREATMFRSALRKQLRDMLDYIAPIAPRPLTEREQMELEAFGENVRRHFTSSATLRPMLQAERLKQQLGLTTR